MEFTSDIGRSQRLMAASSAGIARRKAIMDNLSLKSESRIIDIGCGGGHLLRLLAKALGPAGVVYGLDPSEDQIAQAKTRCAEFENIQLLHSSATKMDLEDASFDTVTSTQTLEYIPDVDAAISECTRILKGYGELLNISILWDHFRFYGAEEKLNEKIHDAFRAHCSHQMLPMELPGKLANIGYKNIKHQSLAFMITSRAQDSPAIYTEEVMSFFALRQGIDRGDVSDWRDQLKIAETEGRFGFTSHPVLTSAVL